MSVGVTVCNEYWIVPVFKENSSNGWQANTQHLNNPSRTVAVVTTLMTIVGSYALNALLKPHALNARNRSKIRTNKYRFYFLENIDYSMNYTFFPHNLWLPY